jgi:hypothetical protein
VWDNCPSAGLAAASVCSPGCVCGAAILIQNNARYNGGSIKPPSQENFFGRR